MIFVSPVAFASREQAIISPVVLPDAAALTATTPTGLQIPIDQIQHSRE